MDFNNNLTQEEIDKLNINDVYNKLEESNNTTNIKEQKYEEKNMNEIRYFEVLTDGYHFWVSIVDMENICTQISVAGLESIGVKLDTEVVFGETYVNVNDEFLIYVQKNTNNPKYVPQLVLLRTKNRDYNYENKNDIVKAQSLAQTVDSGIVIEEEYEVKTR